uniref:Uncharacterized protein n=1 Tax=Rhizophora mucronata TaxID=61149 RepID=A0A2P2NU16_RHIMU
MICPVLKVTICSSPSSFSPN